MKPNTPTTYDDQLVAVAERRADRVRALLVRKGERPTVLDAREFEGSDPVNALLTWAESNRCGDVRVMLPASSTIVRQTTLPNAIQSQMIAAMRLQAEGMFLGAIPAGRMGLGIMPDTGDADRQGVIVAWPIPASGDVDSGFSTRQEKIVRYVPEVAALIPLGSGDTPAVFADRESGSIAIAMEGRKGLVLRAARETASADDPADWANGVRQAIAETVLNAGIEPSKIAAMVAATEATASQRGDRTTVMIARDAIAQLRSRLSVQVVAAESESNWWNDWAILLGATIIATGPLGELARLQRVEEGVKTSRVELLVKRYSDPARALRACVAGFIIVGFAPVAFAWMRSAVIQWKMPEEPAVFERNQKAIDQRISHYRELGKRTLPVTKILGDLACCTPDGIEIESIQLSGTQGVSVRGVSKAKSDIYAENLVTEMASNMDASGVFEKSRPRFDAGDGRGILKFDIEAPIVRPTLASQYPEARDWAKTTLAQRKYGKPGEDEDGGSGASSASASGSSRASSGGSSGASEDDSRASSSRGEQLAANGESDEMSESGETGETNVATAEEGASSSRRGGTSSIGGPARGITRRPTNEGSSNGGSSAGGASAGSASSAGTTSGAGAGSGAGAAPSTLPSGAGAGGGPAATALANAQIPATFTDEELRAMTRDQARGLLSDFAKAKGRADLDEATRKRLQTDFNRILDYLKSLT